nr:immunoglobulin heavy chain junction region [Mus musculus]
CARGRTFGRYFDYW